MPALFYKHQYALTTSTSTFNRMTTLKRTEIHYAWIVLAVTFACLFVGSALRSIPGIIMLSLEKEFQWNREIVSGAIAVNLFLFGLAGPFLGRLMDMYGVKAITILMIVLVTLGAGVCACVRVYVECGDPSCCAQRVSPRLRRQRGVPIIQ